MESFIIKSEPKFENIEEHEYHIQVIGYDQEEQSQLNSECSSSNGTATQPQKVPKEIKAAKKDKTLNKVIKGQYRKKGIKDVLPFTIYIKKIFLGNFMDNDCSSQCIDKCLRDYNVNREELKKFFGNHVEDAKKYVYQECDSLCFRNIMEWLKHFEDLDAHRNDNYESAVIMNAIVCNEPQPDPKAIDGVNLNGIELLMETSWQETYTTRGMVKVSSLKDRSIYKFISNALMGLPQKPLDPKSAQFLSNEFESLINEANTDEADDDVRTMKTRLESLLDDKREQPSSTLDPLNLTDTQEMYRICQNSYTEEKINTIVKKEN